MLVSVDRDAEELDDDKESFFSLFHMLVGSRGAPQDSDVNVNVLHQPDA